MVEILNYSHYSREQLVEEVNKKEVSRAKLKEKLVQLKELSINTAQVLQVNRKLEEQLSDAKTTEEASAAELQRLRTDLNIAHDLTQEANTLLTAQERQQQSLQKQLGAAKAQASKAEHSCSQAKAAKAKSDMAHKALEKELAALKKQFIHFQTGLDSIERQQKADHKDVEQLKTQAAASAPAPRQSPLPAQSAMLACQGCSAVQEAFQSLQMQLQAKELASGRGSTKASSAPSTQDHSGDTHDDRVHLQVCSELRGVQEQLLFCQDQQERFEAEMHRWRTLFGSFAALAAPNAAALPGAPGLMQISPTGAEGSNVMARRSPEVQVRAGTPRASQTALQQALTTSPPVARIGSTAGEPELAVLLGLHPGRLHPSFAQTVRKVMQSGCKVYKPDVGEGAVVRVSSAGEDSDTFSAAAGTTGSMMLPAQHRLPQHQHTAQRLIQPRPVAAPDAAALAKTSPKRKAIALQPGALQLPECTRKRRRVASAAPAQQSCHVTQQPQQPAPVRLAGQPGQKGKHAECADATAVEFMERQLARICNAKQAITATLVSAVAQDICTAWRSKHCPLDCIVTGFIAVLLDCAAAPSSLSAPPSADVFACDKAVGCTPNAPHLSAAGSSRSTAALEDGTLAQHWCSDFARQQHHVSWLMHCALELDGLLSSPAKAQVTTRAGTAPEGPSGQPPKGALVPLGLPVNGTASTGKKRGRPPGSRNKKTLLKLQAEGLSLQDLAPSKPKEPAARQQQLEVPQHQSRQASIGPLPEGSLLSGLHRQALHYLGQTCQIKLSGPFETEACCLSAAAAGCARLLGKVQAVRAQVINVLCSFDIDSSVRLSCAAAAVEVWPEALLTPAAADSLASSREPSLQTLDLLGLCMHAYVQHLCQEHRHKESEVLGPARLLERASTTEQRAQSTGKTPLLHWGQSAAAQTAAQLLQQLLSSYWEAQTAELAEAGRKTTSQDEGVAGQAAATLATLAAGKALAELQHLGTTENGDTAKLEQQWVQLGFGLQLMVGVLGWEWAYEQVLNKIMGPIVSAHLGPATRSGGDWAVHSLRQMLNCMKLTVQTFRQSQHHRSVTCAAAVKALLTRLTGIREKHKHNLAIYRLLDNTIQSMQTLLDLPVAAAARQVAGSQVCHSNPEVETF